MKNTWPYMAWTTPMSRTRPARSAKTSDSSRGRPKSLTSIAPATLKRSVMVEPIVGVELHRFAGQPLQPAADPPGGRMNSGISTSAMRLICQDT